jgi:hypothetical protein
LKIGSYSRLTLGELIPHFSSSYEQILTSGLDIYQDNDKKKRKWMNE